MWITDYRESKELELWQFQQQVNEYGKKMENPLCGTVSGHLIHMLEVDKNAVTHPRIADVIAILCGATSKQRDMIVDKKHWNTFDPSSVNQELLDEINNKPFIKGVDYHKTSKPKSERKDTSNNKCAVVKLDMSGNTIERYDSITGAAEAENMGYDAVKSRCKRLVKKELGVFKQKNGSVSEFKYTFRFANEWDKMTREQKLEDVKRSRAGESV